MIRLLAATVVALGLCLGVAGCAAVPAQPDATALMRTHPDSFIVVTVRNDSPSIATRAGSTIRGYEGASSYSLGAAARTTVHALASDHHLREVSGWPIAALGIHCVVFELPGDITTAPMLDRLRHDSRVESAQPLQSFTTQTSTYNDPYEQLQSSLVTMEVQAAHQWSRGAGVHIAVIDTGVDVTHPDLAGRIAESRNFVDADAAAFQRDRHGTAMAGVIAASANNKIGIVGVAPEASVHAYKACWQQSETGGAVCNTFTLAKALGAAIDSRVRIVNLSLAGPADSLLTRLIVAGQQQGIVFVGAAPPDPAASGFPTAVDGVIEVAALGERHPDQLPGQLSAQLPGQLPGELSEQHSQLLLAPGTEVLTLAPQGHYDFASGSSVATANVSGTIALLLARDRSASAAKLRQLMVDTARHLPAADASMSSVNACAALAALLNAPPCHDPMTIAAE